jgi:hypothetical protein
MFEKDGKLYDITKDGKGIRYSRDKGANWSNANINGPGQDIGNITEISQVSGEILAKTTKGLFASKDGVNWSKRN